MTREAIADLHALKSEFNLAVDGDEWGNTVHWWHIIADEIHFNRPDLSVPDEWQFRPSPCGSQNDPEDYATDVVQTCNDENLMRFGALVHRYARMLKHLKKDY